MRKKGWLRIVCLLMMCMSQPLFAEPFYEKIYRTVKISDAYYFLMLGKDGKLYHLHTNKTLTLTPEEIKSPNLNTILDQKQSWGPVFFTVWQYTQKNGKLYTKDYWDLINVVSPKQIEYLNQTFYLQ